MSREAMWGDRSRASIIFLGCASVSTEILRVWVQGKRKKVGGWPDMLLRLGCRKVRWVLGCGVGCCCLLDLRSSWQQQPNSFQFVL